MPSSTRSPGSTQRLRLPSQQTLLRNTQGGETWLDTRSNVMEGGVRTGGMCARIQALLQSPPGPNLDRPPGWNVQQLQKPGHHYMCRMYGFHMPLFNQIQLHPCSPALQIQKTILATQGDNARQHNLSSSDRNCGQGSFKPYYACKKEDASRISADEDCFALRSRSRINNIIELHCIY